jgi:hypothetical protein
MNQMKLLVNLENSQMNKFALKMLNTIISNIVGEHFILCIRTKESVVLLCGDKYTPIEFNETLHASLDSMHYAHDKFCLGHDLEIN